MNKHTSGPWTIGDINHINLREGYACVYSGETEICTIHYFINSDELLANFKLIEAAPDLLAAAEWALKKLECVPHLDDPDCYACGPNPLRTAIAKARGEK